MPFQYRAFVFAGVLAGSMVTAIAAQAADKPGSFAVCGTCHKTEPGQQSILGPNLFGIMGREAGTQPEFGNYSDAMKSSGISWTPEKLDEYLKAPQQVVPGTTMAFPGLRNDKARADIVAYLESLK